MYVYFYQVNTILNHSWEVRDDSQPMNRLHMMGERGVAAVDKSWQSERLKVRGLMII